MKECPYCKKEMPEEATKCKDCEETLNKVKKAEENKIQASKTSKSSEIRDTILGGAFFLIILIVIFWVVYSMVSPMSGGKTTSSSVEENQVCVHAQDFMRDRLSAPSTARFPSCSSGIVKNLGNNVYGYAGYVDAQNTFGATVRSKYYVEMEFTGGECRLLSITIE